MTGDARVAADRLRQRAAAVLAGAGSAAAEAEAVAAHLVEANLRGHDSHGVQMVAAYVIGVRNGTLRPNRAGQVLLDAPPFLHVDGERGYGQIVAREATTRAIATAASGGACLLSIRNAGHMGRIGTYGEMAAAAGLVALFVVNGSAKTGAVAPHGGAKALLGTNPLCIAVPGPTPETPFVLDMATAKIAHGKVRAANNRGATLKPDLLLDADGKPTTDPGVLFRQPMGALLPLGEHKGYGMAVAFDILAGALSGGGTVAPRTRKDGGINNNLFGLFVDPGRFGERASFAADVAALLAHLKAQPPRDPASPVLTAGEPERATRAERLADGVPVDAGTWKTLVEAGASVGVALPATPG